MLSYEDAWAAPLAVLDEIAVLPVPEYLAVEDEICVRFVEALVQVAEEAGVDFDVVDAMTALHHDLLSDGQRPRAAAVGFVQAWFLEREAEYASLN